ncbi:MAG: hypothetical protein LBB75_03915, partial [Oscillospiraceae bacterium]|nr:hypothetical protein [Oscillospiraceae bacterium]
MRRIFAILMSALLAAALFAGCGKTIDDPNARRTSAAPDVTAALEETQAPAGEPGPLTRDILGIYNGGSYHVKYANKET